MNTKMNLRLLKSVENANKNMMRDMAYNRKKRKMRKPSE